MRFAGVAIPMIIALAPAPAPAAAPGVVIDEVFFRAPRALGGLQWIELHNPGDRPVDLSGWRIDGGKVYVFSAATEIAPGGYLVVASDPARFRSTYSSAALGPLARQIRKKGERLALTDAAGKTVDAVRFKAGRGWPLAAGKRPASLERICPAAPGDVPANWAVSPLAADPGGPPGTPGRRNACWSAVPLPVIEVPAEMAEDSPSGKSIPVEADIRDALEVREASVLFRTVTGGAEGPEARLPLVRDAASGRWRASIPGQPAGTLVRWRLLAGNAGGARRLVPAETDPRPTFSTYVHEPWRPAKIPFGLIVHVREKRAEAAPSAARKATRRVGPGGFGPRPVFGPPGRAPSGPGSSCAFIHVDERTGRTTVYDHIRVTERGGRGWRVHFTGDRTFDGISVLSIIFEGSERFLLAEGLAYDVYRRAGNAAPWWEFVRLWVDGSMAGYHLMIERPNRAFLRRNEVKAGGELYKVVWFGSGPVGTHQKRTHRRGGHDDLLAVIRALERTRGDAQWKVIRENFDVPQVATYFAVNMILSHWDGFFNNHFSYHDTKGTKKWQMYPWDQDKTWGHHDGLAEEDCFVDMPLTFGMEGARPPGGGDGGFGMFGGGPMWWRPGGVFSRPLLANPRFRKVFLARTREILETVYTPEIYLPLLEKTGERLREDAALRAEARGEDGEAGVQALGRYVGALRKHLIERRRFLLAQKELKELPPAAEAKEPAESPRDRGGG